MRHLAHRPHRDGFGAFYERLLMQSVPRLLDKKSILGTPGQPGLLPIKNTHFYTLIARGDFPPPLKIGRRSVWRAEDVALAIERLTSGG